MSRYIGNTTDDREQMLNEIGYNIDSLFKAVPDSIRLKEELKIPEALSEMELIKNIKSLFDKNLNTDEYVCFMGAGAYDHYIPSAQIN